MSERADAIEALVESPGWQAFVAYVAKEWSAAACWHKVKAAGGDIDKVNYTNTQVGELMTWPAREIERERRLEQEKALAEAHPSRRGVL